MEISLLKALLNSIYRFNNLASSSDINVEPVQKYYQKIDEILKLLRSTLDGLVDSQISSNEQLNKAFEELDGLVNEARELIESCHPTASKFYFVMQVESQITRIQASCMDVFQILNSLQPFLPDDLNLTSVEQSIQKLRSYGYEQTSSVIKEAMRAEVENSTPSSESMVKIADSLSLTTNQGLLMEAVALEKVKLQAEQDENDGEAKYIDHMICLVTLMHDLLVKIKQTQSTTSVPIPPDFCCPLSLELMRDPVIVASGQTYERTYIRKWLDLGLTVCPKTRQTLSHTNLIPNYTVKALIANWCETNNVNIPDPVKSMNLNQTSALLSHTDSGPRDTHILSQSKHASARTNHVRSTSSSHKNVLSSSGTNRGRKSPSHGSSDLEGAMTADVGNGFGLDMGRISIGSSEERDGNVEERITGSAGQSLLPSKEDGPEVSGADEHFQGHSRNASVSSTISNSDSVQGTPGDTNGVSQVPDDLTSNASGELTSESPSRASFLPHRESEFSPRLMDTRSRSHTIWRRPTERYVPRIVSSSAIDTTRADLLGIEIEVKKLVENLQSTSVDLIREATCALRLLAKHNMDNRIVIANCGAISLLVGLLHSTDTQTQENAVTALLNLSINDNNKSIIANADAIEPLIHVLETGSPEAKENSAATLFSLSVVEENKVRIGRSGAIVPLVELLGNGTPRGKKDAATALFNLSIFHENKARIVQAGAAKYLVELMDPAAGMVDKAVAVLSNLATIPEGRSAIGQAGGIPVLVEVVELGSARGKENAAAALLQLCTNSNRFCSMVLQEGAVPPLVALSQSGTPRAKEKICRPVVTQLLDFFIPTAKVAWRRRFSAISEISDMVMRAGGDFFLFYRVVVNQLCGLMEISLLRALLNCICRFNNLASLNNINVEPVKKYYQKIDEIMNLLRPTLNVIVGSEMASNEQLIKVFEELDGLVNEATELVESCQPVASKFYFVMQVEPLIARIQASCMDVFQLLNSLHQYLPDDLNLISVEHSIQKLQCYGYDQTSSVIKEAMQAEVENSTPSSESMVKIAVSLSLTTNQEFLMEAVALESVKLQAEQDENYTEAKYIDHMVCLVTVMHDLLVKTKYTERTTTVPIPSDFCCPLSLELMRDPVIVASGQTYERTYIRKWLDLGLTVCPKTRQILVHTHLIPNYTVKALIANWCETNNVNIHDPVKSMNLNLSSALSSYACFGPSGSHILPRQNHPFARTNHVRSTSSLHENVLSSSGTDLGRKSPSHTSSDLEGALNGEVGNGFGLDVCRISLGSSEDRDAKVEYRNMGSAGQPLESSKVDNPEANGSDEEFQRHSQNASVSSTIYNSDYVQGTPGGANGVSQVSDDLSHYNGNASGELIPESTSRASLLPHSEREFSPGVKATWSSSHPIWRQPTEQYVPRIITSSAIDTRVDILGIETQVKKLVEDVQSTSIDLQRVATSELRLLAKDTVDNRIVIANSGAISLLVALLHSADTLIQENAVTALLNLSINDNNKSVIAIADAIDPLIHVLETGSSVAKENSAATLFSLSVNEENKVRIGRSGAIGPLVELLGNGTPRGKKDAATALFNLSVFHENKAQIVQAGAARYLVELMDPAAAMVDKAVAVLSNLATIPEGRSAIGQAGGIPLLVDAVELGSARVKEHAAAALLLLCTNSSRFCGMVLQQGPVPPLVALSQSGSPRAKEK
ncbi:hypothetical protein IFM89_002613, partial [Coptis chinensis]